MNNQRRHLRLPARALECTTDHLKRSLIVNLSAGGICLQAGAPVSVSDPIEVRCDLAALNSFFEATGEVAWTDPSGRAGVRFLNVPGLSRARLIEWLFHNALAECADASARVAGAAANNGIACAELELDAVLHLMATRAQLVTRADGAAIALAEGNAMLCRARSGAAAPELGVRPDNGSGLSRECLRTGGIVMCADSETDSRPDLANCRSLGIRSAILMPLQQGGRILGLLGVLSKRAYVFDTYDIDTLKRMAALIVAASFVEQAEAQRNLAA